MNSLEIKTPNEWMKLLGIVVLNPQGWYVYSDGWYELNTAWADTPITRDEFKERAANSTCQKLCQTTC